MSASLLQMAASLDPGNPRVSGAAGRELLRQQRYVDAAQVMGSLASVRQQDPFLVDDLIRALDGIGDRQSIIQLDRLYEDVSIYLPTARAVVVRNYLEEAQNLLRPNDIQKRVAMLQRILSLQPGELYSTYQLYRLEGASTSRDHWFASLQHFPIESVTFSDERTFNIVAPIVSDLYRERIWDRQVLYDVLAFWIWRYPHYDFLENLLLISASHEPAEAAWANLLNELHRRRSDTPVNDSSLEKQVQCARDGASRLLVESTEDTLLTWPLGNTSIKSDNHLEWFAWTSSPGFQAASNTIGIGAFAGGTDDPELPDSLRIDGFWTERSGQQEEPRAGFWLRVDNENSGIMLQPDRAFILTFAYKTDGLMDGDATMHLCPCPALPFSGDHRLPATSGHWRCYARILFNSSDEPEEIRPLMRNWGTGRVWFAGLRLAKIGVGVNPAGLIESPWDIW